MVVLFLPHNGKKGKSHMASHGSDGFDGSGSWFNRPARAFPAQIWLAAHYGFRLPPLRVAPQHQPGRRPFPAQVWLATQRGKVARR